MKSEQLFEKFGRNGLIDIIDIDISSSSKVVVISPPRINAWERAKEQEVASRRT